MSRHFRAESVARQAFEAAAQGGYASAGATAFPTKSDSSSIRAVERTLSAGGDMNPPWVLLDAVLELCPEVVLAELAAAHGFKVERLPEPEATSLERLAGAVEDQLDQLRSISDELTELRRMRKVEPARRGRAAG